MRKLGNFIFRTIGKFWVISALISLYYSFLSGELAKKVRYVVRRINEIENGAKENEIHNKVKIGFASE